MTTEEFRDPRGAAGALLVGPTWRVEAIAGVPLPADVRQELTFDAEGRVSGRVGVNRAAGTYALDEDVLSVGPLGVTRMAGPPEAMEHEAQLLAVLSRPLLVRRTDRGLALDEEAGSTLLVVVPLLTVRGTVGYREPVALSPTASVAVSLQDAATDPPTVLAEEVEVGRQVPVPFALSLRRDEIPPGASLSVSARVDDEGELLWSMTSAVPVATEADVVEVDLLLVQVPPLG